MSENGRTVEVGPPLVAWSRRRKDRDWAAREAAMDRVGMRSRPGWILRVGSERSIRDVMGRHQDGDRHVRWTLTPGWCTVPRAAVPDLVGVLEAEELRYEFRELTP